MREQTFKLTVPKQHDQHVRERCVVLSHAEEEGFYSADSGPEDFIKEGRLPKGGEVQAGSEE